METFRFSLAKLVDYISFKSYYVVWKLQQAEALEKKQEEV